ncbi:MAG: zinc ribbon domain-containing protein, partial [Candidatus Aenigmatarchaeota archaeon]
MFGKKEKCPRCGEEINKDWNYCPFCGYPLKKEYRREEEFKSIFGFDEFDRLIEKELKEFDKLFKMDFKIPRIKIPEEGGFSGISITIHSGTGIKPKIEVKTYGDMKKYEPEI